MRKILILIVLFSLSGCFIDSGTWDNDEDNWERIFYGEKPDDIIVNNSRFWKSPHWSYEYSFFIEIENNPKFISKIIKENNLVRIKNKMKNKDLMFFFSDKPEWFLPESIEAANLSAAF